MGCKGKGPKRRSFKMAGRRKRKLSRRGFLASTGFALAGSANSDKAPSDKLAVAVVGVGRQGTRLLTACLKLPGVAVKAVCDVWEAYNLKRARRLLARYFQDHRAYTDLNELLDREKDLDAVILATPDRFHAEQAEACLEHGLNVYLEAPPGRTVEEARKVVKAARRSGKVVQVGLQRRSDPRYRYCADTLLRQIKLLGRIVAAEAQRHEPVRSPRGWPRRAPVAPEVLKRLGFSSMKEFRNWYWSERFSAGPVITWGSHQLDVLNWFLGSRPEVILGSGGTEYFNPKDHSVIDIALAILLYPLPSGTVRVSYRVLTCNGNLGDYEKLLGDAGTLVLSEGAGRVEIIREERIIGWERWVNLGILNAVRPKGAQSEQSAAQPLRITDTTPPTLYRLPVQAKEPVWQLHLADFFKAVREGSKPSCPPETAFDAMVAAAKVKEAALKCGEVRLQKKDYSL